MLLTVHLCCSPQWPILYHCSANHLPVSFNALLNVDVVAIHMVGFGDCYNFVYTFSLLYLACILAFRCSSACCLIYRYNFHFLVMLEVVHQRKQLAPECQQRSKLGLCVMYVWCVIFMVDWPN